MAQYLQIAVRAVGVGAVLVIVAVASRQVYLRVAAEAGIAGGEEDPAATMLIRCEAMHSRLQNSGWALAWLLVESMQSSLLYIYTVVTDFFPRLESVVRSAY
jgi:hypothetical protein